MEVHACNSSYSIAVIKRIAVQTQPQQIVLETLSPYLENTHHQKGLALNW
jgi:hypothetical protein